MVLLIAIVVSVDVGVVAEAGVCRRAVCVGFVARASGLGAVLVVVGVIFVEVVAILVVVRVATTFC